MTSSSKTYIITTAQRGGKPNRHFLSGLERIAEEHSAENLIILPTNGMFPSSTKADQEERLNCVFQQYDIIEDDYRLNDKLEIRHFPVKAQQMDPTTSWDRFVAYDTSAIMPSPKQRMRVVPNSNVELPKVLMSTGAITYPHYKDNSWGTKAKLDHVYGAIIVEVVDDVSYHYRQLRASKNGVFYDLGYKYDGAGKPRKERLEALVLGDWHVGDTDPNVITATEQLIKETQPRYVLLHDLFNGRSISHHDEHKLLTKIKQRGDLTLEEELELVGETLSWFTKIAPKSKIVVVKSNHDEWIDQYLEEGRFVDDPRNTDLALRLFQASRQGYDTLEKGVEYTHGRVPGVRFLSEDDDFKVRGYQLAAHGHIGLGGTRGTTNAMEKAYGKSMSGHIHTPEILRNTFRVGTSTHLDLEYVRGATSWMNTHGLIPKNGQPQLVNMINGKYRG